MITAEYVRCKQSLGLSFLRLYFGSASARFNRRGYKELGLGNRCLEKESCRALYRILVQDTSDVINAHETSALRRAVQISNSLDHVVRVTMK